MRVPLPLRLAYPLSFFSGLLYWAAFPGIDVWPLSFVALVPLFVSLAEQRPKHGFWIGWTAGFGMTITGFYWLSYTLGVFSGFPAPLCWLFQAILCAYQAGRIGLFGWLATRGAARGWGRGLTLTLGFVASELLFPLLFPWFYGATVHQVTPLIQVAELGGPIAVSLVLLAFNYALAELLLARLQKRAANKRVLIAGAAPILALVYGFIRISMVDARAAAAEKVEVGLVQANMSLMAKRENPHEGLDRHLRLTRELKSQGHLDLVVWSETSVMAPVLEDEADAAMRRQFSRSLGVPALFGSVLAREVTDARKYALFNAALLTNKRGSVIGRFDKQLLLAFGEYLPFGETFPILYEWSPHTGHFQSGTSFKPLSLDDHQIAVVICYEDVLPSFVNREMREGDPELIANLTNDAWFGDTTEPWIHMALAKFRAVEQRKFFVRSTNSGVSAFVDPVGRIISHTKTFEETSQRATLRWLKGKTLYTLWGDGPWWLASGFSILFAFKRRGSKPGLTTGRGTGVGHPGAAGQDPAIADSNPAIGREAPEEGAPAPDILAPTSEVADPIPESSDLAPEVSPPAPSRTPDSALPGFPKPGDSKA